MKMERHSHRRSCIPVPSSSTARPRHARPELTPIRRQYRRRLIYPDRASAIQIHRAIIAEARDHRTDQKRLERVPRHCDRARIATKRVRIAPEDDIERFPYQPDRQTRPGAIQTNNRKVDEDELQYIPYRPGRVLTQDPRTSRQFYMDTILPPVPAGLPYPPSPQTSHSPRSLSTPLNLLHITSEQNRLSRGNAHALNQPESLSARFSALQIAADKPADQQSSMGKSPNLLDQYVQSQFRRVSASALREFLECRFPGNMDTFLSPQFESDIGLQHAITHSKSYELTCVRTEEFQRLFAGSRGPSTKLALVILDHLREFSAIDWGEVEDMGRGWAPIQRMTWIVDREVWRTSGDFNVTVVFLRTVDEDSP